MTEFADWRAVKAKARSVDPAWDAEQRVERRRQMRLRMLASINGAKPAKIRKELGMTQAQLGHET